MKHVSAATNEFSCNTEAKNGIVFVFTACNTLEKNPKDIIKFKLFTVNPHINFFMKKVFCVSVISCPITTRL